MQIFTEDQLRSVVDMPAAIDAIADAFVRSSRQEVVALPISHLAIPGVPSDVCVKGAFVEGQEVFVIKVSTGFYDNAALGLPSSGGMQLVFSATTGEALAVLADNGFLTDLRTGAAGGVAAQTLTPDRPLRVAILGAGIQCAQQLDAIGTVRAIEHVAIWSRSAERAQDAAVAAAMRGFPAVAVATPAEATRDADLVVTVTPSTEPLIARADVGDDATIIAVGADGEGKRELAADLIEGAGCLVADDPSVARERGELQYHPDRPAVALGTAIEVGGGRPAGIIVVDLVGLGAQDAAISGLALAALQRSAPDRTPHVDLDR